MKKTLAFLLAVLLVFSLAPAAFAAPNTEKLEADDAILDPVSGAIAFKVEYEDCYQLMDAKGKILVTADEGYSDMDLLDGFFRVEKDGAEDLKNLGLLATDGTVIIPAEYGLVEVLNDRWQAGILYKDGSEADYDLSVTYYGDTKDTFYYLIDTVDFFFDGEKVGTLEGEVCRYSRQAFGAYLGVTGKDSNTCFFNSKMEPSPYEDPYMTLEEYDWDYDENSNEIYIHQGTGQIAFQPDCTLTPEEVENALLYKEGKIYDLQGKEVCSFSREYEYINDSSDEFAVVELDDLEGLVSLDGKEIIPPEYDALGGSEYEILKFGYIAAEKDGKFGFFDAKGKLVCDILYPAEDASIYGNVAYLRNDDGLYTVITAEAGELPEKYTYISLTGEDGCVAFAAEKADESTGLVDVKGKVLIPFSKDCYGIDVTEDGSIALATMGDHYLIYHF